MALERLVVKSVIALLCTCSHLDRVTTEYIAAPLSCGTPFSCAGASNKTLVAFAAYQAAVHNADLDLADVLRLVARTPFGRYTDSEDESTAANLISLHYTSWTDCCCLSVCVISS